MTNLKKIVFGDYYQIPSKNGINRPSRMRGQGYKMINMGELFANDRIYDIPMELVPLNTKEKKLYEIKEGDLLFARQSIVAEGAGKCSIVMEISKDGVCFESHIIRVRLNIETSNSLFFYYFFQSELGKGYLSGIRQQGVQAGIRGSDLVKLKVPYYSLNVQNKIALILSKYEDLIENNLSRINLLIELAQNLFDEFYTSNNFFEEKNLGSLFGHEIGGGWGNEEQTDEFNKAAYVIRGTDIDELPNGKIENVPFRFHKKSNLASRKLQDGDIIFEVSGGSSYEGVAKTLLVTDELLKQFDNAVMPASFCKLARPADKSYSHFIFLFLRFLRKIKGTEVFEIRSASNIVNYNWTAFLKFQKVNKPNEDVLIEFNQKVEPIYKQIYNLGYQNQYLKEARDILLPRLMTGMIDVEKIELEV